MTDTHAAGPDTDVIDILTTAHREMLELLGQIEGVVQDDVALTDGHPGLLGRGVAEEMHVYPVMEKHLPGGAEEVEHDKKEHDDLVRVMKQVEGVDASEPAFMELIREMQSQLRHHIEDEESDQFPKLRAHIPAEDLVELGRKVQNAKKVAPTRPHPSAPHSELFHKTVGPGVGMVDRLRDRLTGRSTG